METGSGESSASMARPSRLIAEALVLRHDSTQVEQRAQAMGLSERLTQAVVSVCCRESSLPEQREDRAPRHIV